MAARAPASALGKELSKISKRWIQDPFRPHLQLSVLLDSLATHPRLTPEAVKAARALQNDEIAKKYPLSEKLMKPASMPKYYDRIQMGLEKSLQGIARPWWKIMLKIW